MGQATWGGLLGLSLVTQSPGSGTPLPGSTINYLMGKMGVEWNLPGRVLRDSDKHRKHVARCPTADSLRPLGAVDVTEVDMLVSVCVAVFENAEVSSKSEMRDG